MVLGVFGVGSIVVGSFALSQAGSSDPAANLLMVAAIELCGLGYAEGTVLTRRLGGWQTICWALLLALVPMAFLAWQSAPAS